MDTFRPERRSEIMARIHSGDTTPELTLRRLLHRLGLRFRVHCTGLPGKPDIVLARYKTAIFVHGCFWHGHEGCREGRRPKSNTAYWERKLERNKKRDRRNIGDLRRLGWRALVVWECQLASSGERVAARLKARMRRSDGKR